MASDRELDVPGKGGEQAVLGGGGGGGGGKGGGGKGGEGWCRSSMLTRIDTSFQPSSPSHLERHPSRGETWL